MTREGWKGRWGASCERRCACRQRPRCATAAAIFALTSALAVLGAAPVGFCGQKAPEETPAQARAFSKAQGAVEAARTPQEKSAAMVALGRAYFDEGQEQKADAQYAAALELDPLNASAHLERGRLRISDHNAAAAAAEFQAAIHLAPDAGAGYSALGQLLVATGHPGEARPLLEKAADIDPTDWNSRYQLALILLQSAQYVPARELLDEVVQIDPGNMPAREQLALDRFRHGDGAGATADGQSMVAKDPGAPEGHRVMALSFWKQRQFEASLAECAIALQAAPRSATVLALQALDLWQLDRKKDARQVLTEVSHDAELRASFATVGAVCRLLVCEGRDVAVVNDFVHRNRWVVNPQEP